MLVFWYTLVFHYVTLALTSIVRDEARGAAQLLAAAGLYISILNCSTIFGQGTFGRTPTMFTIFNVLEIVLRKI
jgi:hypothetical protein